MALKHLPNQGFGVVGIEDLRVEALAPQLLHALGFTEVVAPQSATSTWLQEVRSL